MLKTKNIKISALVANVIAIVVLSTILIGSTFAWFTDSVSSSGNKIQAGTLKVDLEILEDDVWRSLKNENKPVFNYTNWEPGYTDVKIFKVVNEGSLALKWKAKIVANGTLSALADVIDVYVCPSDTPIGYPTDRNLDGYTYAGTVADFVAGIETTVADTLLAGGEEYLGIALKMRSDAGNEFQGMDLLGSFDIVLVATQLSFEGDGFGDQYDASAEYPRFDFKVSSASDITTALESGEELPIIFTDDISEFGADIDQPTVFNLAGHKLTSSGFELNDDFTMTDGTFIMTKTSEYIDLRPTEDSVYIFKNIHFKNEYKRKPGNTGTDRIEEMVKLTPTVVGVNTTIIFENCIFENACITFAGLSGHDDGLDVTFKNCTFTALMASDSVINIGNYFHGTVNIEDCTFNITGTYSTNAVIDISNSSNTRITVNATNNTLIANKAVAYTYDASKGETEVDTIKLGTSNVRNYCMFDFRMLPGGYSTINETGTVIEGDIAIPSLKNN